MPTTNASGIYLLPALRPGVYSLSVEASGFRKAVVNNIELVVSDNKAQDVTLEVGSVSDTDQRRGHARPD